MIWGIEWKIDEKKIETVIKWILTKYPELWTDKKQQEALKKQLKSISTIAKNLKEPENKEKQENDWKITWKARMQEAMKLLWKKYEWEEYETKKKAIVEAHYIGPWKNTFEYTAKEIEKKWLILKNAWFEWEDIRKLIESWICGDEFRKLFGIWVIAITTLLYNWFDDIKLYLDQTIDKETIEIIKDIFATIWVIAVFNWPTLFIKMNKKIKELENYIKKLKGEK